MHGNSVRSARQVACLNDVDAHLALEKDNPFAVQTKPHGHGDVHALLHTSGLLKRWVAAGVRWVAFFQDTNALVFRGLPAALGLRSPFSSYTMHFSSSCCGFQKLLQPSMHQMLSIKRGG